MVYSVRNPLEDAANAIVPLRDKLTCRLLNRDDLKRALGDIATKPALKQDADSAQVLPALEDGIQAAPLQDDAALPGDACQLHVDFEDVDPIGVPRISQALAGIDTSDLQKFTTVYYQVVDRNLSRSRILRLTHADDHMRPQEMAISIHAPLKAKASNVSREMVVALDSFTQTGVRRSYGDSCYVLNLQQITDTKALNQWREWSVKPDLLYRIDEPEFEDTN